MSRKVYVRVISETDERGKISPISVIWEDGRSYSVDKIVDVRRACAIKVGGTAMRYTVNIEGKQTYVFFEDGKWFVESKV